MANPVVQQPRGVSSWSGAASAQAPSMAPLGQVASAAMNANANMYASTLNWDANKFDSKNRRNAQMFDSLLDWDSENRRTDAQFAAALPAVGLQGMGGIGRESVGQTGGMGSTGIANTGSTIANSQNNAAQLEAQQNAIEEKVRAQRASGLGGILGGAAGLAGTISSVLGQPALGEGIKAAGNLYGGRAFR